MQKIYSILKKITGKEVLFSFIIFLVVYVATNLIFKAILDNMGIKDIVMLDVSIGYSPDEAFNKLEKFTDKGRNVLIFAYMMDFVIPILYTIFFVFLTAYLLNKISDTKNHIHILSLIPIAVGLLDYAENTFILIMISNSTKTNVNKFAVFSNLATQMKAVFMLAVIFIIIISLLAVLIKKIRCKSLKYN